MPEVAVAAPFDLRGSRENSIVASFVGLLWTTTGSASMATGGVISSFGATEATCDALLAS